MMKAIGRNVTEEELGDLVRTADLEGDRKENSDKKSSSQEKVNWISLVLSVCWIWKERRKLKSEMRFCSRNSSELENSLNSSYNLLKGTGS